MLDSGIDYARRQVLPRTDRVLGVPQPWLAGLLSLGLLNGWVPSSLPSAKLDDFSTFFATYDTVVFGFCVAAVTIAMAVPNVSFMKFLSKENGTKFTAFQDLVFVFSWTCFSHLFAFALCFIATFCLPETATFGSYGTLGEFSLRWLMLWIQFYCMLQFGVAAATVFQFADLYAKYLRAKHEG